MSISLLALVNNLGVKLVKIVVDFIVDVNCVCPQESSSISLRTITMSWWLSKSWRRRCKYQRGVNWKMPRKKQQNPQPVKCTYPQTCPVLGSWLRNAAFGYVFPSVGSVCAFGSVVQSVYPDLRLTSAHQMLLLQHSNSFTSIILKCGRLLC